MGLKSLIANQVQGAMRILGTDEDGLAPAQYRYVRVLPGTVYDHVTRTTVDITNTLLNVPMTMVRFRIEDMDAEVRPKTDRRALVASLDLPGVTPAPADYIIDSDGSRWNVVRLLSDPAAALIILHLRKE